MSRTDPPRILLIEDDADTAELVSEALRSHFGDIDIKHCDSLAALRALEGERFSIALCDYNLPDGTGFDAIDFISGAHDGLPVIMVTGDRDVETAVGAIRRGACDYIMKVGEFVRTLPVVVEKNLEVARIRGDNHRLQAALASSLAELKRKNRELEEAAARFERMASTDLLTDLANRRLLDQRLEQMFSEAVRYDTELSCLMIDLDGFKFINDTLGHQKGDELLRATGRIINAEVRASDLGARYGGDEFVIILPRTSHEPAVLLAQRLMIAFQDECRKLIGENHRCGMSVGIASLKLSKPNDPQQFIAQADVALYTAKISGKTRTMVCKADGASAVAPEAIAA